MSENQNEGEPDASRREDEVIIDHENLEEFQDPQSYDMEIGTNKL